MKNIILIPIVIHALFIVSLTTYTSFVMPVSVRPIYLIFSTIFFINTLFSLNTIMKFRNGVFYYLLNIMFLLGFWFKFSLQKITMLGYPEPIGTFIINSDAETRVLWIIIIGMCGFFLAQVLSYSIFTKLINTNKDEIKSSTPFIPLLSILLTALILALLNLKFNILVFGLKPSLILPLKGNAIYFLALTRGTMFLYCFYCLTQYSSKMVIWGALIAAICSIGVLSRMTVITFFAIPFVLILQSFQFWKVRKTITNTLTILISFIIFSYITVFLSTGLRSKYINETSISSKSVTNIKVEENILQNAPHSLAMASQENNYFDMRQKMETYKKLALGRWIGIEGVMAVDSYPKKSIAFIWEALKEKSYRGNSFYTKISDPQLLTNSNQTEVFSTSVPGPLAFFYYSGSYVFVFMATIISSFFFSLIEHIALIFFSKSQAIGVFVSTFIVFDFFQFGISPMAFVRYLFFSLFSIVVFYYFFVRKTQNSRE